MEDSENYFFVFKHQKLKTQPILWPYWLLTIKKCWPMPTHIDPCWPTLLIFKVEKLAPLTKCTKISTLYMAHNSVKWEGIWYLMTSMVYKNQHSLWMWKLLLQSEKDLKAPKISNTSVWQVHGRVFPPCRAPWGEPSQPISSFATKIKTIVTRFFNENPMCYILADRPGVHGKPAWGGIVGGGGLQQQGRQVPFCWSSN